MGIQYTPGVTEPKPKLTVDSGVMQVAGCRLQLQLCKLYYKPAAVNVSWILAVVVVVVGKERGC
jgi:hypothetical protein